MDRRVRLVYENGVEFIREIGGPWYALRAGDNYESLEREPEDLEIFYTFRPVFYTDLSEHGLLHDSLLSPSGGPGLSQRIAETFLLRDFDTSYFDDVMNLLYMLESACYHCIQLADAYTRMCKWHADFNPEHEHPPYPRRYSISAGSEGRFEFDSLVTSLRRVFESSRYLLWHAFGSSMGTQPKNFERVLKKLEGAERLPPKLSEVLRGCWDTHGTAVKDYRDCVLHSVPLDPVGFGGGMDKHEDDPLATRVDIPDNPKAKSASAFTYEDRIDALGFGWESFDAVLACMEELLEVVLGKEEEAKKEELAGA